jgi:hypothetical protein
MKKSLIKATAIVVCFAFLLLSFPGVIQASPRTTRSFYQNFFTKPLAFFAEFMSFLPIFDYYPYQDTKTVETRTYTNKFSKNMKTTGGLSSQRPSKED